MLEVIPWIFIGLLLMLLVHAIYRAGGSRLATPQLKDEPFLFTTGGTWGDAITWLDVKTRRVYGHKFQKPEAGDILTSPMESGRIGIFLFTFVEWQSNPPDMFIATVRDLGYTDTPEGAELLARCKQPTDSLCEIMPPELRPYLRPPGS